MASLEELKAKFIVDVPASPVVPAQPKPLLRCEGCGKKVPARCPECGRSNRDIDPRFVLPPGWSQFGVTRYKDALTRDASWCPRCGDREWAKVKREREARDGTSK